MRSATSSPRNQVDRVLDPEFPVDHLDSYINLILLCCNHHKEIDDLPQAYSVAKLGAIKREHEHWVRARLGVDGGAFPACSSDILLSRFPGRLTPCTKRFAVAPPLGDYLTLTNFVIFGVFCLAPRIARRFLGFVLRASTACRFAAIRMWSSAPAWRGSCVP